MFTISDSDTPEKIRSRIRLLIVLYTSQPEQEIAIAIAAHINAILAHPKYIKDTVTRCQFRRLSEHWRYLAWNNGYVAQDNISTSRQH